MSSRDHGQASRPGAPRRPSGPRHRREADVLAAAWAPAIHALAEAVVMDDWLRIVATWEQFRLKYEGFYLRSDTGLEPRSFLVMALGQANARGLLRQLGKELIQEGLVTGEFEARLVAAVGGSAFGLQAFQGGVFRPFNAVVGAKDMLAACDQVCRIDVDGLQTGTGVQVSQTLVATAAHVVWNLVTQGPDGSLQPADGSLRRLSLTFGDAVDYVAEDETRTCRRKGEVASLHPNWLAWASQPTDNERAERLFDVKDIDGISSEAGPWDLALIRLAEPRLTKRRVCLLGEDPPANPFAINILHHPHGAADMGEPLLCSIGQLDSQLGVPPVRFLHDADTLEGSSGAPVFDSRWRIVALHQGGERMLQSAGDAHGLAHSSRNRAVPIRGWFDRLDRVERSMVDDVPYLRELTNSPDLTPYPYPVIGRRETQQRLWRAMRADATAAQRLLIIRGAPGTGLRFSKRLVREFVTAAGGGVVVTLTVANALSETPVGFAERVIGALSAQLPPHDSQLTTLQRNIRSSLLPSLGSRLEELARGQSTWLVLDGFYETGADLSPAVKDLIADLATGLGDYPVVRLVLVGWQEIPAGYEDSVEDLYPPTAEDIMSYLAPPGEISDPRLVAKVQFALDLEAGESQAGYPAARRIAGQLARRYRDDHQPENGT